MVETKTVEGGAAIGSPVSRMRFQLGNHLGSAILEVTETGAVISSEEYHPYGTTAYRSSNGSVDVSARRYRYTGKERDDETGLYYNGARYLAAWLGRWTSADPIGIGADGPGLYNYTRGSPVGYADPSGTDSEEDKAAYEAGAQSVAPPSVDEEGYLRGEQSIDPGPPEDPTYGGALTKGGHWANTAQFIAVQPGDVRTQPSKLAATLVERALDDQAAKNAERASIDDVRRQEGLHGDAVGHVGAPTDSRFSAGALEVASLGLGRLVRAFRAFESEAKGLERVARGGSQAQETATLLLPSKGATTATVASPVLADTNLLIQAAEGGSEASLAAIRANRVQVTSGIYAEFVANVATHEQRVARMAFLEREGISVLSREEAALLRGTKEFSSVTGAAKKAGHSLRDAELAGFARASGREVLSGERRLTQFFNMSQPQHGVRIRRVQ